MPYPYSRVRKGDSSPELADDLGGKHAAQPPASHWRVAPGKPVQRPGCIGVPCARGIHHTAVYWQYFVGFPIHEKFGALFAKLEVYRNFRLKGQELFFIRGAKEGFSLVLVHEKHVSVFFHEPRQPFFMSFYQRRGLQPKRDPFPPTWRA